MSHDFLDDDPPTREALASRLVGEWVRQRATRSWNVKDMVNDLAPDLAAQLDRYPPDVDAEARKLLRDVDRERTRQGRSDLDASVDGPAPVYDWLPFDLLSWLALGNGDRCIFRYAKLEEMLMADHVRYANVRAQQRAYDEWRHVLDSARPYLQQGYDMGTIVERGLIGPRDPS